MQMKKTHSDLHSIYPIKTSLRIILLSILITGSISNANAQQSGPLMGWASWNQFGAEINDSIIRSQAHAMAKSGLKDAGFKYINIDDGFFKGREKDGGLGIDTDKFPHRMKSLADYIHSLGLKAGFYSEAGENTCGSLWSKQPGGIGGGLYGHDQQDIDSIFKVWGYDFLKVDFCGGKELGLDEETRYTAIKQAIDNTGRKDISYNVCRWEFPGVWITKLADSWRISHDINFRPGSMPQWSSITDIIDISTYLAPYASPGHYNDMDMLEVGRGMTLEEDRSHLTMWCMLASPLLLGHDMTKMSEQTRELLCNREVLAIDQDPAALQAQLIRSKDGLQVWSRSLGDRLSKERAVVLFNRTEVTARMEVSWDELNITGPVEVRDLWAKQNKGKFADSYAAVVPAHGVVLLKLKAKQNIISNTYEAEYAWINEFNHLKNSKPIENLGKAVKDPACSGGAKACWLGNSKDNYLEFRHVFIPKANTYNLSLYYQSGEDRDAIVSINGEDFKLKDLNSGNWSQIQKTDLKVRLKKGYNVVRISNPTGWLPDIDKIMLK